MIVLYCPCCHKLSKEAIAIISRLKCASHTPEIIRGGIWLLTKGRRKPAVRLG